MGENGRQDMAIGPERKRIASNGVCGLIVTRFRIK